MQKTFRIATFNLMGMGAPVERRLELTAEGLADLAPDVVGLQEVCQQDGKMPNQAALLAERLGWHHVWARAKDMDGGVQEGLAFLSRHPILEHQAHPLPTAEHGRIVLTALVQSPAGPLRLFNTHLDFFPENTMRERQVVVLSELVRAHPGELPSFVMGDFNATPEHDEIRFLRGRHSLEGKRAYLHDAYARRHPVDDGSGCTWAKRNPITRRWRWMESDRRIDFIFVSSIETNGRGEVHSCRVALDQPDDTGLFPSDHFAVYADVQLEPAPAPEPGGAR